jgi:chaperonin GroEL
MTHTAKPKSVGKIALPRSPSMIRHVLDTLKKTAEIVGSTLGPFGQPVLLERQETGMKPIVTKDGVTVFKHLGYHGSVDQVVLEAARDAVVRTAQEAGDGTTTATLLAYAIAEQTHLISTKNRKMSPQRIVRAINKLVPLIESEIDRLSFKVDGDNYKEILHKVASLSANGDTEMADLIMKAFDTVGEQGNITVTEEYGLPAYEIHKFDGFTIEKGYEESCEKYYSVFINDNANNRVFLEKPIYLLFDGKVNEYTTLVYPLQLLHAKYEENPDLVSKNIVILAHGFSDTVLSWLAFNFVNAPMKVFPMLTQQTIISNSQTQFLHDVSAFTGAAVFNPMSNPIQQAGFDELVRGKSEAFEAGRYRSTIIGLPDATSVELRVQELKNLMTKSESVYDKQELEVRIGKLTCGIAKVKVLAPSQVEIREKKDRIEDAWCAIRSASKHGALPGGCWTLIHLSNMLNTMAIKERLNSPQSAEVSALEILSRAFLHPVEVLYRNAGYTSDEIDLIVLTMMKDPEITFDLHAGKWVNIRDLLDSAPAVLEAIRNSISISTLLGTLGGIVVFQRSSDADSADAKDLQEFMQSIKEGEQEVLEEFDQEHGTV